MVECGKKKKEKKLNRQSCQEYPNHILLSYMQLGAHNFAGKAACPVFNFFLCSYAGIYTMATGQIFFDNPKQCLKQKKKKSRHWKAVALSGGKE